ncbi:uncharacterized protein LOC114540493 [Dendronephthya gigantea]|uniref:uncharacterized protein LOC114540493 n=1 Tax=Dendronephthya gigantea TaxID=151771 RepID=UPI0010696C01|nr:uncharacterized protein LOC114540493 [Dendronephthya gigantea]
MRTIKMAAKEEENVFYCGVCAAKLRDGIRYCWKCKSDQTQVGPPTLSSKLSTSDDSHQQDKKTDMSQTAQSSFGRPQSVPHGKVLTFEQFLKKKTSKENVTKFRPNKKAKSDPNEVVMVYVGIKRYKDGCLKTVKGKRLPIRVPKSATCNFILQKATEKMAAFDRSFDTTEKYDLLYEDGSHALFMPGTKDFFELEKYRFELGRDYKRITLYLCTQSDIDLNEGMEESSYELDEMNDEMDCSVQSFGGSKVVTVLPDDPSTSQEGQQPCTSQDEQIARQLQQEWNEDVELVSTSRSPKENDSDSTVNVSECMIKDKQDVIHVLSSKIESNDQFFIITRRKAAISRIFSLWQRQAKRKSPTCRIMVKYSGEAGIDSGAIACEFLEDTIAEIASTLFKDGIPVNSTHHVQNGDFRTCGEIAAASLAQGGPPPCFLDECAYNSIFTETDLTNVDEKDLAEKEKLILDNIRLDCTKHSDFIIEHGFTGIVDQRFIQDIVNSLKVRFVSDRMLYMKEFKKGLDVYGLGNMIEMNPDACRPLFVKDFKKDLVPDADYLFSLMKPIFSEEGSTKRVMEESIMDHLQDVLISLEDTQVSGYSAAVASNINESENEALTSEGAEELFETADMSVGGVMGWLTGQRHKHVTGTTEERPTITINFDHECLLRNPDHKTCFPVIGACGRELTIPVVHMDTAQKFKEIFILAYCMGQPFAKP